MTEARQLALALPHPPALTEADFVVGDSNAAAVAMVERYPAWPNPVAMLIGPKGSGKTHLATIWRERSGATEIRGDALAGADLAALLAGGAVLVEDIDGEGVDATALFHLLNLVREMRGFALLTSRVAAADLSFALPDLRSRLRAAFPVLLEEPDDALLAKVVVKLFADRQLEVDANLVAFLARRMERSLEFAARLVAALDAESLASGKPVTRPLATRVLAMMDGSEMLDEDGDEMPVDTAAPAADAMTKPS